jgi:hypothetical protein
MVKIWACATGSVLRMMAAARKKRPSLLVTLLLLRDLGGRIELFKAASEG